MASVEQWTAWRKEYLLGLRMAIEEVPFKYTAFMLKEFDKLQIELDIDAAKDFVVEALEKGILDENDPAYPINVAYFAFMSGLRQEDCPGMKTIEDAENALKKNKAQNDDFISHLGSVNGYFSLARWFIDIAVIDAARYYVINNPLIYKKELCRRSQLFGRTLNLAYCRLSKEQLFDFFCQMTSYGLYKLFADINCSRADELFQTIKNNDLDSYNAICEQNNIDFIELREIVGCLLNGSYINIVSDTPETIRSKAEELNAMIGIHDADWASLMSKSHNPAFVESVLPFKMTEDESYAFTTLAFDIYSYFCFFETMDADEILEVNRILDNPYFEGLVKIAQYLYITHEGTLPDCFTLHLSPQELELAMANWLASDRTKLWEINEDTSEEKYDKSLYTPQNTNVLGIKTLASRWMTEPYQRMTDDTLVELFSRKIWPQILEEVDGLQWTPARRGLPSFPKIKNMLAACILFHALELAKIAKLPKQEEQVNDYDGLYGEEDRALTGVVSTSDLRAGITHTQKKYNDTLPVGYMEVLKMFLAADEMPGRTTSRNYLKLVNKWLRIKYEDYVDNLDSAKGRLLAAECQKDLGPQLYLLTDNRKRMRAILKEWRDLVPKLFNIPI